jgi:hypothetical protein
MQMFNPTYKRIYGKKYDTDLDITDIAKAVRKDIKQAIKAGDLPQLKCSVRISRFAGGRSLNVYVKSFDGPVINPEFIRLEKEHPHEYYIARSRGVDRFTDKAGNALELLKTIVGSYNMDGSDVQSDYFCVNFYSTIDFEWRLCQDEREAIEAKLVAEAEATAHAELVQRSNDVAATMEPVAAGLIGLDDEDLTLDRPEAAWNF